MGKFRIEIEELAKLHIKKHLKSGNNVNIKKNQKISEELTQTPFFSVGNPEPLKHQLSGFWSREINKKDRIIYKVDEDEATVFIVSAMDHYYDK